MASQYTALCITQDNELIRILPAQRVVYAARNIVPVVVWPLLFHLKQRRHNFTTASWSAAALAIALPALGPDGP